MKTFRSLPKPSCDETFSSWVYRCGCHRKLRLGSLLSLKIKPIGYDPCVEYEDPDFDKDSSFFNAACAKLGISASSAWNYFKPQRGLIARWQDRVYYCDQCFRDDLANFRLPIWRRGWCFIDSVYCDVHQVELITLKTAPSLNKAWSAFSEMLAIKKQYSVWAEIRFSRLRYLIHRRASNFLDSMLRSQLRSSQGDREFLIAIYQLSLKIPSSKSVGGIARKLFYNQRSKWHSSKIDFSSAWLYGPSSSTPRERYAGLLVVVWLIEAIPETRMEKLRSYLNLVKASFPSDAYVLGRVFMPVSGFSEFQALYDSFGKYDRIKNSRMDLFLLGFEASIAVELNMSPTDIKFGRACI